MRKNRKQFLAMLLCLVMCLSLLPVTTRAEGQEMEEAAAVLQETEEPAADSNEVPEINEEPEQPAEEETGDGETEETPEDLAEEPPQAPTEPEEQPQPETEEQAEEPSSQEVVAGNDAEGTPETVTVEQAEVPEQPAAQEEEEQTKAVTVTFLLTPEDAELTLYTKDAQEEKTVIEPEEDGTYLLFPGEYFYDAVAEECDPLEEEKLTIEEKDYPEFTVEVPLERNESIDPEDVDEETTVSLFGEAQSEAQLSASEMATSGTCGPNLTWSLDGSGVLTISGTGKMTDYTEREGYHTTLAPWGEEYYKVKQVVINQGVTSIGNYAFHTCSNITSVSIPSSVTSIGVHAFFGCRGITSLTLPERGVTSIGSQAFSGCSGLTAITIPKSVTTIGDLAFSNTGLTSIIIPDSVTSIGSALFMLCKQLRSVILPGNLKTIPTQMFDGCTLLSGVTIPDTVTEIRYWAFKECTSLESITIPATVSMLSDAFVNCTYLNSVTFNGPCPRTIGADAFSGVTATVYYYRGWTTSQMKNYGGNLTWVSRGSGISFDDVANPSDYFYDPVYWAVERGITTGRTATTFDPYGLCTRGHIVTFLWRAMSNNDSEIDNPFTDISPSDSFYQPVLWAYQYGITTGQTATTFGPWNTCTRGQIVTFIWRAMGEMEPETTSNPFTDVKPGDYFYKPVLWAVGRGITTGRTPTTFDPWATCTRGQAVTFIYRALNGA